MIHARSHQVAEDTLLYRTELAEQVQGAGCKMHVFRCPVPHRLEMFEYQVRYSTCRDCCLRGTGRQGWEDFTCACNKVRYFITRHSYEYGTE